MPRPVMFTCSPDELLRHPGNRFRRPSFRDRKHSDRRYSNHTSCIRSSRPTIRAARCKLSMVALPLSGSSRRSTCARLVLHELGHALLCDLLFLHLSRKLAGNHGLDGCGRNFRPDTFGIEPAFEARSDVRVLSRVSCQVFCHDCISFNRWRASVRSSAGVLCAFLMMACRAIIIPS